MSLFGRGLQGQSQSPPAMPLVGASGASYRFGVYPLGQHFQELPGVYAICKETAPKTLSVLYVGETHNFDARVGAGFMTHHKWAATILDGATHICALVIRGDRRSRLTVEADLRQSLNPPLNSQ